VNDRGRQAGCKPQQALGSPLIIELLDEAFLKIAKDGANRQAQPP